MALLASRTSRWRVPAGLLESTVVRAQRRDLFADLGFSPELSFHIFDFAGDPIRAVPAKRICVVLKAKLPKPSTRAGLLYLSFLATCRRGAYPPYRPKLRVADPPHPGRNRKRCLLGPQSLCAGGATGALYDIRFVCQFPRPTV